MSQTFNKIDLKQHARTCIGNRCAQFARILFVGRLVGWLGCVSLACSVNASEVTFARPPAQIPIQLDGTSITRWRTGSYEVLHLQGEVRIDQQSVHATADEAILWIETPDRTLSTNDQDPDPYKVIVYLEGQAVVEVQREQAVGDRQDGPLVAAPAGVDRIVDDVWLGRLFTTATVDLGRTTVPLADNLPPPIFNRAQAALADGVQTSVQAVQYQTQQHLGYGSQGSLLVSPTTGAVIQTQPQFQTPAGSVGGNEFANPFPPLMTNDAFPGLSDPGNAASVVEGDVPGFRSPSQDMPAAGSNRRSPFSVDITRRDPTVELNIKSFTNPSNLNERVSIGTGGVRVMVESPDLATTTAFAGDSTNQVVILADNVVQWQTTLPNGSQRRQFYIEGNVVFAKGRRVIYADRMYYDVELQQGTILNAEVLTPVPQYRGLVRLKANVVQQVDANNLQAFGSAFTSSRLGVPRYWLQTESLALNRQTVAATDPDTGLALFDPATGMPQTEDEYTVDTRANRVYLAGVPIFAWPRFRTNLNDPSLYLERFGVNNDSVFGFQVTSGWDMYQLLGFRSPPKGTKWTGLLDYLGERGVGLGSEFEYQQDSLFGIPGNVVGQYKSWFINDSGLDQLGLDRLNLAPEEDLRGRIKLNHRHDFEPGFRLRGELGYISDRNFLEQYYEREWDSDKDATTGFWLERNLGTQSFNLTADIQVNDFFTQTSWLPRFDHFMIGQPVFNNRGVWHNHSHAGYAKLRVAEPPTNAVELAKFDPLAWEANVDGVRVGTRQELDFPIQLGPTKLVPYVLGDATHWQEDINGNDLTRLYGQTGVRASLPMWRVDPSIQSVLWNVNGLAHKVTFDFDAFVADASEDISDLPLYDQLDDDSQEHFRRRFAFNTFGIAPGGDTPLKYDERFFALRSGMQGNVTAPSNEIADDLAAVKFGVRQRWQTKRGMPGQERIIDWITLDAQTMFYPDADRDNFGADLGMFDYDFRWFVGDRFSILSDGYADFFGQGLRTVSVGTNYNRPETGDLYLGVRSIEGPISSNVLTAALTYRMSEKWGLKAGSQYDFSSTGNIGQTLSFVYIGESFLWQMGANYDVSRDNLGFRFGFEPRFLPKSRLFRPGGDTIPPAGARWLE